MTVNVGSRGSKPFKVIVINLKFKRPDYCRAELIITIVRLTSLKVLKNSETSYFLSEDIYRTCRKTDQKGVSFKNRIAGSKSGKSFIR